MTRFYRAIDNLKIIERHFVECYLSSLNENEEHSMILKPGVPDCSMYTKLSDCHEQVLV